MTGTSRLLAATSMTSVKADSSSSSVAAPFRSRKTTVTNQTSRLSPALRQVRLAQSQALIATVPFDDDAARAYVSVAVALRTRGHKVAARAFDALIAATAMSRGLPLYTCNPRDFEGIDGLDVVAVPHPDEP